MRHLTAHQLPEGGWHYASTHRRGGYPLGYCRDHEPHPTEAEARECYSQWQRDHLVLDDGNWSWGNCEHREGQTRCKSPANKAARIEGDGYQMALLCPEHMTRGHAIAALGIDGPAGDSWES